MRLRWFVVLAINAVAIWAAVELLPNVEFDGRVFNLVLISLAFGVVNTFIGPFVKLITLPLNLVTLGLFSFVVNGLMLLLVANFSASLNFDGRFLQQVAIAVLATMIISILSSLMSRLITLRD